MVWKFLFLMTTIIGLYLGFKFLFSTFKTYEEPLYRTVFQEKSFEIRNTKK